jgi:hypothetical protein
LTSMKDADAALKSPTASQQPSQIESGMIPAHFSTILRTANRPSKGSRGHHADCLQTQ